MYLGFLISLQLSVFHYQSSKFLSVFRYQPSVHYLGIGHDSPIFHCLSFATAIPRQVFCCQPFIVSLPLSAFRYQSSVFIVPSSSSQSVVSYPCFSQLFVVSLSLSVFYCLAAFRYQSSIFIVPSSSSQSFIRHPWEGLASDFLLFEFPSAFHYQSFVFPSSSSVVRHPWEGLASKVSIVRASVISLLFIGCLLSAVHCPSWSHCSSVMFVFAR